MKKKTIYKSIIIISKIITIKQLNIKTKQRSCIREYMKCTWTRERIKYFMWE